MEARRLIKELEKLLSKGIEVSLATGMFVLQFSDKKIKVLDIEEFEETLIRLETNTNAIVFSTDV